MIKQLLEDPEFWKQASQSPAPPTTPEQQQQVYLGLIDGFKAAGCNPAMVAGFLEAIMEQSPMAKEAGIISGLQDIGHRIHGGVVGLVGGAEHPDLAIEGKGLADAYSRGGIRGLIGQGASDVGGAIHQGWNYLTDPKNVAKWSPYVVSGLGSMAAAKMMGANNWAAAGAGVAGGYMGGRAMTGQPIIPKQLSDNAGYTWDKAKNWMGSMMDPGQQRMKENSENAINAAHQMA